MKFKCKYFAFLLLFFMNNIVNAQEEAGISFVYAKKLFNDGLYELAAEQFHQFAEQNFDHPKAPEALLMAGKCFFNNQQYQQAIKEFSYLITRFPDANNLDEAQFSLGQCFEKEKNYLAAAKAYQQVYIFYPRSSLAKKSLLFSGIKYKMIKKYDLAKEVLYELIETFPSSEEFFKAKLVLSDIFIETKKFERAKIELDKLLSFTDKGIIHANALFKKAELENQTGRYQEAELIYKSLLDQYSSIGDNPELNNIINKAHFKLAKIYSRKGFYDSSNEQLQQITDFDKQNILLYHLGKNYYNLKSYSNAIQFFEQVTTNNQDSLYLFESCFYLGECYSQIRDYINANNAYQKAIRICKKQSITNESLCQKCFLHLSSNYRNSGKPKASIKVLRNFLAQFPSNDYIDKIYFQIADIYEKDVQNFDRAIRAYYDFIDNFSLSNLVDEAQYSLARCFDKKGDYSQALQEYKNLINSYPASQYHAMAQARMKYINNFKITDTNILKNFSKIMQQLFTAQREPASFFKIGLIYFNELKDYRSAINSFKKSLKAYSNEVENKDELNFYLGNAYRLISQDDSITQNIKINYQDSAFYYFDTVINQFSSSDLADDAAFYKIKVLEKQYNEQKDGESYQKLKQALSNFKYNYSNSDYTDRVYFLLGKLLLNEGVKNQIDSLDIANAFQNVINSSSDENLRGSAEFYLARLFHITGNDTLAIQTLNDFIKNYSKNSHICEGYLFLSKISESMGELLKAEQLLKQIIDQYYYSSCADSAKMKLGEVLIKQKKFSQALKIYQNLYDELTVKNKNFYPANYTGYNKEVLENVVYELALTNQENDNIESALNFYQEYLLLFPKGKYADKSLFFLGQIFSTRKNTAEQDRAINYFKQLIHDFSDSSLADSALIKLGDLYFQKADYEAANEFYYCAFQSQGLNIDKAYPFSQFIIGLYREGKIPEGDKYLKEFKKKYRSNKSLIAKVMLEKGNYYLKSKDFKLAEKIFKDVKSDFKKSYDGARAEFLLGKLNFILNKDKDALEIMTKIIEKYPDKTSILADVYLTLGNFYYLQAKQIQNAMLAYKKVTELSDIREDQLRYGMNNLIKCYTDLRMREQALSFIRIYLNRFPAAEDLFEKKILMGILYYELKEYDRALSLLRKLKYEANVENEPRIQYWIGECYFAKGEFRRAVSEYLKVVYLSKPTKLNWKVTAQYQAGIAYLKAGELEKAKKIFQRIILEQGADSVFGKPANEKIKEIEYKLAQKSSEG